MSNCLSNCDLNLLNLAQTDVEIELVSLVRRLEIVIDQKHKHYNELLDEVKIKRSLEEEVKELRNDNRILTNLLNRLAEWGR